MKNRVPRKKKKQAKKVKARHDAMILVQTAISTIQGAMRAAMIASRPTPSYQPGGIAFKSASAAMNVLDTAESVIGIMSEIKPWREHVK